LIVVVGLSHREAPLEVRERLSVDAEAVSGLLRALLQRPTVREALCVSTCNRTEIYAVATGEAEADATATARDVERVIAELADRNGATGVTRYLRTHVDKDAVRHLFRVASSLDSLVIGEPQILGQMKDAFEAAKSNGGVGKYLERAMSRAFHVAKRVRTETAIGAGQVSVSSVAVDLARQIFGDLVGRASLLLGAGEMAEAAAKLLVKEGANLQVVNRSPERAKQLAVDFGGTTRPWEELERALVSADVVVASTSAKRFVVTRDMAVRAMRARKGRSLFFIDIAVPRDVEPTVNDLDNVYLYDIDNLSNVVAESMRGRQAEAERAEALVNHEADAFETWTEGLSVTHTIVALRTKVRASLGAELEKSLAGRLKHLPEVDRKALDTMLDAAVNKLLHAPTTRIKAMASDPSVNDLVKTVHHLFDLAELARELEAKERARSVEPAPSGGDRPSTSPSGDADVALAPAGADRETVGR
jgi:glutamyl-tRNA reductase